MGFQVKTQTAWTQTDMSCAPCKNGGPALPQRVGIITTAASGLLRGLNGLIITKNLKGSLMSLKYTCVSQHSHCCLLLKS